MIISSFTISRFGMFWHVLSGIASRDSAAIRIRIWIVRCEQPAKRQKHKLCETKTRFFPQPPRVSSQESVLKAPKLGQFHAAIRVTTTLCDSCTRETEGIARAGQEPPLDAHHPWIPENPRPKEFLSREVSELRTPSVEGFFGWAYRDGQSQLRDSSGIYRLRNSSGEEFPGIQGWWASKGGFGFGKFKGVFWKRGLFRKVHFLEILEN